MFCYYQNLHSIFAHLLAKKKLQLRLLPLAVIMMCGVYVQAQNINTATNGLSKPADTAVGLGGTLTQHTDIDLGSNFNFGLKKGSARYLTVLNNGNVGLGVTTPLAQFHSSGTLRLDMFKNSAAQDSILTTDINGNLIFKSIASYFRSNGDQFYIRNIGETDSVIAEMGVDEETQQKMFGVTSWGQVDFGQGAQNVTNKFKVTSYGVGALHDLGNGDMVSVGSSGWGFEAAGYSSTLYPGGRSAISMQSGNVQMGLETMSELGTYANIGVFRNQTNGRLQTLMYAENSGKGNMFTIDSSGFIFDSHNTGTIGNVLSLKIKQNGKMVFSRYRNNLAGDSVLTTDTSGNLIFKSFTSSLSPYNGLTSDQLGLRLGGSLQRSTTFDGNNNDLGFGTMTSPLNNLDVWANNNATVAAMDTFLLYGGHLELTGQSALRLNTNGGDIVLDAQSSGSGILLSNGHLNLYSADSITFSAHKINLGFPYKNNSQGSVLTTDADGKLVLKSLSSSLPLTFANGITRRNDTVSLGGAMATNGSLTFNDPAQGSSLISRIKWNDGKLHLQSFDTAAVNGVVHAINLDVNGITMGHDIENPEFRLNSNENWLGIYRGEQGYTYMRQSLGSIEFQNQSGSEGPFTQMEMSNGFTRIHNSNGFWTTVSGTENSFELNSAGATIATPGINIGRNALVVNPNGLFFGEQQPMEGYYPFTNLHFNVSGLGDVSFGKYRNNETEDSVLTTDAGGNLKFKSFNAAIHAGNGLTGDTSGIRLGGNLTLQETVIDGQTTNSLAISNVNSFGVYGNEAYLTGINSVALGGGSSYFGVTEGGIEGNAGNTGSISLLTGKIGNKVALKSTIDVGYGFTPINIEQWLDTAGVRLVQTSFTGGEQERFRFDVGGRAWFRNYSNYSGISGFNDAPTSKALYIDSVTGQVMYGNIAGNAIHAYNGLISDSFGIRLGGTLADYSFIDAQTTGSLDFQNFDQFRVRANLANFTGENATIGYDNGNGVGLGGVLYANSAGLFGKGGEQGNIDFSTSYQKRITLNAQTDYGYAGTPVNNTFQMDTAGIVFSVYSQQVGIKENFKFGLDGRAYFKAYSNYVNNFYGLSPFHDAPTTKALYVDSLTGQILYGDIIGTGGSDNTKWGIDSVNIYNVNTGNVGIGTITPTAKFHTLGSIRFESFKNNQQGDSVLTTDEQGNLKFAYMPYGSGGGGGASYQFVDGVTQANGIVSLGGQLTDSVKIDLAGFPMSFNIGAQKIWNTSAAGNIGIGSLANPDFRLTVNGDASMGNPFDSVGLGSRFFFNGYSNLDGLWMSRYNASSDVSELRVNIGDDGLSQDKFHIGYYAWDNPSVWHSAFIAQSDGKVGIGTDQITSDLSVGATHGNKLSIGNSEWAKTSIITTGWDNDNADYTDLLVPGADNNSASIRLNKAGNVGIGTLVPDAQYRLSVNGKIRAKGLRVQSAGWADFVFEPDYKPMSLPELEKFIRTYRHLPQVPTAAEVTKEGQDVGEVQTKLLQKIEEMTLYIIELNKQVKELEDKNKKFENQQAQINQMQQQMEELKKMLLQKTK